MPMHDAISSYKCFDAIATQSPVSINFNRNLSNALRSNSLDSLANSSDPESLSDERDSSIAEIGPSLSDCDSINNIYERNSRGERSVTPVHDDERELYRSAEISANDTSAPVIRELLEKAHDQCAQRHCDDGRAEQVEHTENGDCCDCDGLSASDKQSLSSSGNLGQQKTRRTSIASSGSVGRMETIVEEPIEPKISVKEILARFETLTTLEVIIKLIRFPLDMSAAIAHEHSGLRRIFI